MFTLPYRHAEAIFLAPFEYFILIMAAALGFVFWGEVPTLSTRTGSAIITFSGVFVMIRTRRTESGRFERSGIVQFEVALR